LALFPAPEPAAAREVEHVEEREAREAHEAALENGHQAAGQQKAFVKRERFSEHYEQVQHLLVGDFHFALAARRFVASLGPGFACSVVVVVVVALVQVYEVQQLLVHHLVESTN
jgi:hypothetical protein